MTISARDDEVVQLVGMFGQLTSVQLGALAFNGLSGTPVDRCLKRLTDNLLLRRIGRSQPDPFRGGAGSYVYIIGLAGHRYLNRKGRWRLHQIKPHELAVGDVFVNLVQAQRQGRFTIGRFAKEVAVGKARADIEIALVNGDKIVRYYCEVDMGWQHKNVIQAKLSAYLRAWDAYTGETFPRVVFLAKDVTRVRELRYEVSQLKPDDQQLFLVDLINSFPQT